MLVDASEPNTLPLNFNGPRFGDHSERLLNYKMKAEGSAKAHLKKKRKNKAKMRFLRNWQQQVKNLHRVN